MKTYTQNPMISNFVRLVCTGLLLLFCQLLTAQQTYVVTKVADSTAGGCAVGNCSLRSAIQAANADGVPSIIKFDFTTGTAPFNIVLRALPLPQIISDETIIDALLDNNYNLGDVVIDGSFVTNPNAIGLEIMGNGTQIYGLQIQGFNGNGIQLGATGQVINVVIGTVDKGNIIINNGGSGIFSPIHLNAILDGNFIGTDPSFSIGLGNTARGIELNSFTNEGFPVFRVTNSVIGNNGTGGVNIQGRSVYEVSNNIIGTDIEAKTNLGNGSSGVAITNNLAGGGVINNNTIAFSGRGISVGNAILSTISQNSIFCNFASGITHGATGLIVNITTANLNEVSGTSNPEGGTVEVFIEDQALCSGPAGAPPCQGKIFLGETTVTGGAWSLDVTGLVNIGDVVTATVTDNGTAIANTSPFSACQTIACPAIALNITATPSCVAANSGSLTSNPTGGQGPYNFNWSTGANTATISDLPPGIYTLTVTDALGCEDVERGIVNEVPGPTANAGPDQDICAGATTTLNATATGGVGPYTFSWDPGGNGTSITVNPEESTVYNLTATDSQGCSDTDQVIVRTRGPAQPDAGSDQTLCSDQIASLQGQLGGDPSATGIWSASVGGGSFSPNATTLNASYTPPSGATSITLSLTTTNGNPTCPDRSDEMTITYTGGPSVDAGSDQTVCAGTPVNLAGVIGGTGASGGWTASPPGGNFSPDALAPNAVYTPPVGIASVTLTLVAVDASGLGTCPDVADEMTITYTNDNATADAGPDQDICSGEAVSLAGSIGGSATSAQWSTNGDGTFSDLNTLDAVYTPGTNDLANQSITLTLTTDGSATCLPATDNMAIRIRPAPSYTVTGTNPSTCGDPDGNFMISGLNPGEAYTGSYTFAGAVIPIAQDASVAGSITVDNLGDGSYSEIVLIDGFGCSGAPATVVLSSPDGPVISTDTNPICIGSSGNVIGNASGGTAPYTHSWLDQGTGSATGYTLTNTDQATLTVDATSAQAGTISLVYQVSDVNGCQTSLSLDVSINSLPEITVIQIDSASIATTADGSLQFSLSDGSAPYNYSWTGPLNGSATLVAAGTTTLNDLLPGQYALEVEDANTCTSNLNFTIGITPNVGPCTTSAGSLQLVDGGVQACSSARVSLIHNGDQTLDANDALVFVLRETGGNILKINTTPVFDYDPNNMTLNTPYSASAMAGNASAGNTIDQSDPCLDESNSVSITFRESVTGVLNFIQGEETLCQGDELILSTNNLGSINYFWITPNRDTIATNEALVILPNIEPSDAGDYFVIAQDGDCINDQTGPFNLVVNGLPVGVDVCAGDDQAVCENSVILQACDPGPGNGVWTSPSGAIITNSGNANTTATDLVAGENLFVWTVNIPECGSVGTDTVRILYESVLFAQPDQFTLERANTEIFMDVLKNDNIAAGADLELTALTEPSFGILETLDRGFRFYETEMRRGLVEFVYQVCYLGGTCAGTCDTATVAIDVLNLPYLPEGITPDGDGRNDELIILGFTPGNSTLRMELTIANQWGEVVFHANDYTNSDPWKGTFNGKKVPQGAYYCQIKTIVPEVEEPLIRTQTVYVVR